MKKLVVKFFHAFGYQIEKKKEDNLNLYHEIYPKDSTTKKRFYNIGAGRFRHPYWTNVDYSSDWYSESQKNSEFMSFDLFSLKKLPINDNSAEIIYSSHTIEHINDEAAQNLFNEAYRTLKKGGTFRITTPNIDLDYRAYRENDRNYFFWIDFYSIPENYKRIKIKIPMNKASTQQIFLHHFASDVSELFIDETLTKISDKELDELFSTLNYEGALNHCTSRCSVEIQQKYPGNHMNWWNEEKASRMLKKAGFEHIHKSGYGQSFSPALRNTNLFDNTHPKVSLFIEGIK